MKRTAIIVCLLLLAGTAASAQHLRIVFAGDLMGHEPQIKAARQPDSTYDYNPCFRYVKDFVQSADLAILNLEVTLAGRPYKGYPQFSSPDTLAACARDAGFDIMTTANNHCMDRGRKGLLRTLQVLDSFAIPHLGTYRDSAHRDSVHPLMVEKNGIRLALLCYTYGTNGITVPPPLVVNRIDTAAMARDLRVARERGAEFVITLIHWGIEYATLNNAEQEKTGRWLLEHGCDAVIGGHPHVVQNLTLDAIPDNDRYPELVVYSMGNLVSNQRDVNRDGGIMIQLDLERDTLQAEAVDTLPPAQGKVRVTACSYLPYWVHRGIVDGLYQYYIVPSADAVAHPEKYQIDGADLKVLQTFDENTRQRIANCESRIKELEYRYTEPIKTEGGTSE